MKYDWKDSLLFGFGFVTAIGLLFGVSLYLDVEIGRALTKAAVVGLGFGPLALRRAIFGAPELPEPRPGALASLMSMIGLFATLLGTACAVTGGVSFAATLRAAPDFEAEVRKAEASAPRIEITVHGEDPAVSAERDRKRVEDDAAFRREQVADERRRWEETRAAGRERDLQLFAFGLGLIAVGTFAAWARYPRQA